MSELQTTVIAEPISARADCTRKSRGYAAVLSVAFLIGCDSGALPEARLARAVERQCPTKESADYFFPPGSILANNIRGQDDFWREWYSKFLRAGGVLPLWCGGTEEVYRFLWLPSHRAAMILELRKRDPGWSIERTSFADPRVGTPESRADPLSVREKNDSTVSDQAAQAFVNALDAASFWTRSAFVSSGADDGQLWLIEARKDGAYRAVTRHNAGDRLFEQAARHLTLLANVEIPEEMRDKPK